ncbi:MAG: hypothetical protein Athens101410_161 [Parcubacteria group bacterium Athens1014_10]|nr:MAG: hypothetical protein Athens101410_161 [Parcubacteria group bacterium Athens1014_10]TSD05870.1 MAG: hypothetical protein Athens071412_152 [Parcubacteria group bacterium Athens0714_12]
MKKKAKIARRFEEDEAEEVINWMNPDWEI